MELIAKARDMWYRFMAGRNGMDALNRALLGGYVGLYLLRLLMKGLRLFMIARILDFVSLAMVIMLLIRLFSRNLTRRQAENCQWLTFWGGLRTIGAGARARHADKEHKYFTCKECKAICRVPAGKGRIVITCPRCGAQIRAKT